MDSTRQQKFARLIQKELGDLFLKDGASIYGRAFVTITVVKTSPDLGYVKAYLSIMGTNNREEVISLINKNTAEVRHKLGQRIKHQIRHIPTLQFFLDDSFDEVEKIERIFKKLDIPPASSSENDTQD